MKSFLTKSMSARELHSILLGGIAPRPIAFASTVSYSGIPNLSPFSFFNAFSVNPPILIFSAGRRGRNNTTKDTLHNCEKTKEVVINLVNYKIVQQMSLSSTEYPEGVNEFIKSGLTPIESDAVAPFRVAESPMHLECKVNDIIYLGKEGGAGNLIVSEILKAHIDERVLDQNGIIDPIKMDLVARMGENWYSRAKEGLFEVPKPLVGSIGIGFDKLPEHIKNSNILTGNDLGILANVKSIPAKKDVEDYVNNYPELINKSEEEMHIFAQRLLQNNNTSEAWLALMIKKNDSYRNS